MDEAADSSDAPEGSGESADADPDDEPDDGRPEIDLPDDVELVFDWAPPEDPDEAAAVSDAIGFLRAVARGVVDQDPDSPYYQGYSMGDARDYGRSQIEGWLDGGWTMHGTDRHYDLTVRATEAATGVEFCLDDSEMVGKDAETGEALEGAEKSRDSHLYRFTVVMIEAPGQEGFWQAHDVTVSEEATECRT